ncbi:unnamed protein product [Owenia fusiformis]|uniref:Uncharacterized protein n=1 Tax=Owenia fusiformis TaxID=6347 RepID=A0A8J1XIU2_OWEFU|nr:unnamed protein product [Owenia fusiformis]
MTAAVGVLEKDLPVDSSRLGGFKLTIRRPNGTYKSNVMEAIRRRETSSSSWAWDCKTLPQRPSTVMSTVSPPESNKIKRVNSVSWDTRLYQSNDLRGMQYNNNSMKTNSSHLLRPLGECRSASMDSRRWRKVSNPAPSFDVKEDNIETSYADILKYANRQSMDTSSPRQQNRNKLEKQNTFISVSKFPIVSKFQTQEKTAKSPVHESLASKNIMQRRMAIAKHNNVTTSPNQRKSRNTITITNDITNYHNTDDINGHQGDLAEPDFESARQQFSHSRDPNTRLKINGLSLSDYSAVNVGGEAGVPTLPATPCLRNGSIKVTPSAANMAWSVGSWSQTRTKTRTNSKPTKVRFNISNDVKEYVPSEPVCATDDKK